MLFVNQKVDHRDFLNTIGFIRFVRGDPSVVSTIKYSVVAGNASLS